MFVHVQIFGVEALPCPAKLFPSWVPQGHQLCPQLREEFHEVFLVGCGRQIHQQSWRFPLQVCPTCPEQDPLNELMLPSIPALEIPENLMM